MGNDYIFISYCCLRYENKYLYVCKNLHRIILIYTLYIRDSSEPKNDLTSLDHN